MHFSSNNHGGQRGWNSKREIAKTYSKRRRSDTSYRLYEPIHFEDQVSIFRDTCSIEFPALPQTHRPKPICALTCDDRVGHTLGSRYGNNIRQPAFISPHRFFETMHLLHTCGCQCGPASLMTRSGTPTGVATEIFAEEHKVFPVWVINVTLLVAM